MVRATGLAMAAFAAMVSFGTGEASAAPVSTMRTMLAGDPIAAAGSQTTVTEAAYHCGPRCRARHRRHRRHYYHR